MISVLSLAIVFRHRFSVMRKRKDFRQDVRISDKSGAIAPEAVERLYRSTFPSPTLWLCVNTIKYGNYDTGTAPSYTGATTVKRRHVVGQRQ
jgi:hypothetical protein